MSKLLKLFTFHGQGSKFDISKVAFQNIAVSELYNSRFKDYCLNENCYKPDIISLLNNLTYQDYIADTNDLVPKKYDSLILGHSLGELMFLPCNKLIDVDDLMLISRKRDELMRNEMSKWKERNMKLSTNNISEQRANSDEWISSYSLLISPKLLKKQPSFIVETLIPMLDNDIGMKSLTLSLYNTQNSVVLTGLTKDFEELFQKDSQNVKAISKFIKLPNFSQIAFHNKKFLSKIEEPLNDFIFKVLIKNKHSHLENLDIPVFSSYSNEINTKLLPAMEAFTKSSFNTIPLYENCQKIKEHINANDYRVERIDLGPSDVLTGILNKNGLK